MSKLTQWFYNLKVRTKFITLIGLFLVTLIILGSVTEGLFKSSQTITILVNEQRIFIENFDSAIEHFYRYVISEDESLLPQTKVHLQKVINMAKEFSRIDSTMREIPNAERLPYMYEIYKEGVDYDMRKIKLMTSQIKMFSLLNPKMLKDIQQVTFDASVLGVKVLENIDDYSKNNNSEKLAQLQIQFDKMHYYAQTFSSKLYEVSRFLTNLLYLMIVTLVILLGTVVTFISVKISHTISKPVNMLAANFKEMARGNLKSAIKIDSDNEIGDLSRAFQEIQIGFRKIISHAKRVAEEDYGSRLTPNSEEDELAPALNSMAQKLEATKLKTDKESWLEKGLGGLDDQMRGNHTVRELSDKIIIYLSRFLKIEMGAVYVFDEVQEHLELTGSVGINLDEVKPIIKIGEGLIGGAAKNKDCQIIDTKDKFEKSYSASGEIYPEKIYLIPMYFDGRIQAVIELAPVNALSDLKIDFLRMVKERVSINISAAVARYRNKELLDQSLEQAKMLKARDKELNRKLEENQIIREKLSRETALLNSMLKTLPDYIYFKDEESKFIRVSESMVPLFNARSSKDIIGKSDFDYHPAKDAKRYFDEEQEIIKKGEGFVNEIRQGVDAYGEELWTSVTKLPMLDENGTCIGTFGISKDITQIKKLEIEISLQNEKLIQNQEELKATNEELNAQEEELRVANEELAEQTKILVENEKSLHVQQEELRTANEELEAKTNLLESQKEEILRNNLKLTKTQKELEQQAKELELASQYKSEFLANMSHELRTPLNSMLILSKLLGENKNKNLTEEQVKSAYIIYNSGKDLLELINEILDLSKIEAGKMTYNFSDVTADEIMTDIKFNFLPVAENKNLKLEIRKSETFPESVYTDRQRLMQIVKNLLSNAFKFTSTGGITVSLGLSTGDISFINKDLNSSNTYFLAVEDTGVGIPQNKLEAIFDAFQQADGSISRKFGGTGLGLSISKQLSNALGGEIHVSSSEGVGSKFTIYLPLDKELVGKEIVEDEILLNKESGPLLLTSSLNSSDIINEQENTSLPLFIKDDRDSSLERILVLIILSSSEKAQMLIDLCHNRKFNAIAASNISDGIKLAEKYKPEAILLDGEFNEQDELSMLKESKFTAKIPVHIVSRIEDSLLEDIKELETPESKNFSNGAKNIEGKLSKEFRQILLVEDDPVSRMAIQLLFENKDIIIHEAKTASQAFEMISRQPFDCIILDLGLPDFSGGELLEKLSENRIPIPNVIVNTAKELSDKELKMLSKYSDSIVIKGVKSDERLMDEVTLFLHQVSNKLSKKDTYQSTDNEERQGFKGKKILLVDDDIRNVFAMAQIFEEREMEILEAENGEVAIEVLKNNPDTDLVLMDIMMPVMNGYEAMKIIRKTPGIESIPIITLTAKAMKEDYQKAIDSGANDFISKPIEVDKLLSLLKIWLF